MKIVIFPVVIWCGLDQRFPSADTCPCLELCKTDPVADPVLQEHIVMIHIFIMQPSDDVLRHYNKAVVWGVWDILIFSVILDKALTVLLFTQSLLSQSHLISQNLPQIFNIN